MAKEMVELDDSLFVGKGSKRICYIHPHDETKCIKLDLDRRHRHTAKEIRYYKRYSRQGILVDMIAPYHGRMKTNSGVGYVFGLARDFDGKISRSVTYYLKTSEDEKLLNDLFTGMACLKEYMIRHGITVTLLEAHNMVFQISHHGNGKVILIDGIGNNQLLPMSFFLNSHARKVVRRKWSNFEKAMMRRFSCDQKVYRIFVRLHEMVI
ncbi:YrbL family protein [Prosthecochloris sp. SCSIO W1103]|uniref:YrbL family protein n=1 Tax=Prosthecochloris sp. SCSIO W1103 TaxID=2992244 RepID=UPI00223D607B|nr:YrbL family protein [Prosthecochloris sp. SCSIO W1103]UZJ37304.1 YrbL family protein [Prosthecochloris sp. SCSIO W1103]